MVRPNPAIPNTVEREKMKEKMMGPVGRFWNVITMGAAFVIMMLAAPGVLRAQNATITGTVTDASHGLAAGVKRNREEYGHERGAFRAEQRDGSISHRGVGAGQLRSRDREERV